MLPATTRLHTSPQLRILTTLLLLLSGITAGGRVASAQTGLYAEFGGSKVNAPSDDWIYGPTFGVYEDFLPLPFVHLGADLRGSVLGVSQTTTLYSGLIGPRLSVHPHVLPINPYIEALAGIGHYDYGRGQGSDTQFEYQFLGGIDHTLIPRLDWRVIEFSYGGLSALNSSLHPKTISTGLVLRLP
jgi:hypothetical protein